jgi:adenine-specific DNA-methyltransferase
VLWYAKSIDHVKYRQPYGLKSLDGPGGDHYRTVLLLDGSERPIEAREILDARQLPDDARVVQIDNLISQGYSESLSQPFHYQGREFECGRTSHWKTTPSGMERLKLADRLAGRGRTLRYRRYFDDFWL